MKDKSRSQKYDGGIREKFFLGVVFACCVFVIFVSAAGAASQDIAEVLKNYLRSNYPWHEIEISNLVVTGDMTTGVPENIMIEKGPPGKTVFSIEYSDGRMIKASAQVRAFEQVVVVRRGLGKGHTLRDDDVYSTVMDISRIPKSAVKNPESVIGKQLARSVVPNMTLVEAMVIATPVVKKGRRVALVVESPVFSITAPGEIREHGQIGNHVKVMNLASKKIVTGLLIDESTVKVEF
jgi:flagella basal body P-ring formation protein FlgA